MDFKIRKKTNYFCSYFYHYLFILLFFIPNLGYCRVGYELPWGKDSELISKNDKTSEISNEENGALTWVANRVILFHQNVLSPIDGPRSHFRPSSSMYMRLAINRYGFFKGFIMGCDRLIRENDEVWVYRTIDVDDKSFKFDPAIAR